MVRDTLIYEDRVTKKLIQIARKDSLVEVKSKFAILYRVFLALD